jgi:hypothetical protein
MAMHEMQKNLGMFMNAFTKEELKELMYGLWCRAKIDGKIINKSLYEKLKSMIDNYCEHEKVVPNWGPNTQCDKCGEIW